MPVITAVKAMTPAWISVVGSAGLKLPQKAVLAVIATLCIPSIATPTCRVLGMTRSLRASFYVLGKGEKSPLGYQKCRQIRFW